MSTPNRNMSSRWSAMLGPAAAAATRRAYGRITSALPSGRGRDRAAVLRPTPTCARSMRTVHRRHARGRRGSRPDRVLPDRRWPAARSRHVELAGRCRRRLSRCARQARRSSTARRRRACQLGTAVHGEIDWQRRYALMRHHTALHSMSGVIYQLYGATVTGGQMYPDRARMDFLLPDLSAGTLAKQSRNAPTSCWPKATGLDSLPAARRGIRRSRI